MKTSYQLFSLGILLAIVITVYAASFRGQAIQQNQEQYTSEQTGEALTMIDSFLPIERRDLPPFRHLVIDCPELDVMVMHSDTASDVRLKHQFTNTSLDDLFSFQLKGDTLVVSTRRDAANVPVYCEVHSGTTSLQDEHHYIKLGLRSPALQSIRLTDQSMMDLFYRWREFPDSIFGERPKTIIEAPRPNYLAPHLDIYFEGVNSSALYLDVEEVNLFFPDLGPSWNTMVSLAGKTETIGLHNPSFSVGGLSTFSTDTLRVVGEEDYMKGHIWAQINHYLEINSQPNQRFEVTYNTRGNDITKKMQVNPYTLVQRIE